MTDNHDLICEIQDARRTIDYLEHQIAMMSKGTIVPVKAGMNMYIVAESRYEREVIEVTVDKIKITQNKINIICSGKYFDGSHYSGTFKDTSIGRKLFYTREEAERRIRR